jgi:hypothetical protein
MGVSIGLWILNSPIAKRLATWMVFLIVGAVLNVCHSFRTTWDFPFTDAPDREIVLDLKIVGIPTNYPKGIEGSAKFVAKSTSNHLGQFEICEGQYFVCFPHSDSKTYFFEYG